jgi:hypothetical protein
MHGPVGQDGEDGAAHVAAPDGPPSTPMAEEPMDAVLASVLAMVVPAATAAAFDSMGTDVHSCPCALPKSVVSRYIATVSIVKCSASGTLRPPIYRSKLRISAVCVGVGPIYRSPTRVRATAARGSGSR